MRDKLPSWVPDWSQEFVPRCFTTWKDRKFAAGGRKYETLGITSPFDGTVAISGLPLDTVKFASSRLNAGNTEERGANIEELWINLQLWWLLTCETRSGSDPSDLEGLGDLLIAFERTISYSVDTGSLDNSTFFSVLLDSFDGIGILNATGSSENHATVSLNDLQELLPRPTTFCYLVEILEEQRLRLQSTSFFVTEKDHIGLCCGCPEPAETVVVFFGAKMPFIIRPEKTQPEFGQQDECVRLNGESYGYGIMAGEALSGPKTRRAKKGFRKKYRRIYLVR
jgi:hypothetical protein